MNDNEITLKINCNIDEFKGILENKSFKFCNKFLLDDTFFIPNTLDINDCVNDFDIYKPLNRAHIKNTSIRSILNNAILLRHIVGYISKQEKYKFTIKTKKFDKDENITEQYKTECDIKDYEQGKNFLEKLNYKEIMRIKEIGTVYQKDDFKIEIKDIQNGEKLIEIEENAKYPTIDSLKKQLKLLNLPIDTSNYFVKKAEIELSKIVENT